MTVWYLRFGSGSADPSVPLTDRSGSESCYFLIDLEDDNKKLFFLSFYATYYFLKVYLHHFSKIESHKEIKNSRNREFSYYFCMMMGGSGRPKNLRIRNDAVNSSKNYFINHSLFLNAYFCGSTGTYLKLNKAACEKSFP